MIAQKKRLYFGLKLPDEYKQSLFQWRAATFRSAAGRPIAAYSLPLTLAFPGETSTQKLRAPIRLTGNITQPTFTLTPDDDGHWPPFGIVWLGPRNLHCSVPVECFVLFQSHFTGGHTRNEEVVVWN